MYFLGKGVPQDFQKAMEYFLKASDQGYALAQLNIGIRSFHSTSAPNTNFLLYRSHVSKWERSIARLREGTGVFPQECQSG